MILLDSYAVLAVLKDEPAAGKVEQLMESNKVVLSAISVAEIVDRLVRLTGISEEAAVLDVAEFGLSTATDVDVRLGLRSGLLRSRHYHRTSRAVSLADCVLAESARTMNCELATSDPHLLDMCIVENIEFIALPDSQGNLHPGRKNG